MKISIESAEKIFIDAGFKKDHCEHLDCEASFYRREETDAPKCLCNDRIPVVGVELYDIPHGNSNYRSIAFGLTGKAPCGWVQIRVYGFDLDDQVLEQYERSSSALLESWTALFQQAEGADNDCRTTE
jgi:hypothetical protein